MVHLQKIKRWFGCCLQDIFQLNFRVVSSLTPSQWNHRGHRGSCHTSRHRYLTTSYGTRLLLVTTLTEYESWDDFSLQVIRSHRFLNRTQGVVNLKFFTYTRVYTYICIFHLYICVCISILRFNWIIHITLYLKINMYNWRYVCKYIFYPQKTTVRFPSRDGGWPLVWGETSDSVGSLERFRSVYWRSDRTSVVRSEEYLGVHLFIIQFTLLKLQNTDSPVVSDQYNRCQSFDLR